MMHLNTIGATTVPVPVLQGMQMGRDAPSGPGKPGEPGLGKAGDLAFSFSRKASAGAVSKHLSEPLVAAADGRYGDGLRLSLCPNGSFEVRFDNKILKPVIGKHCTCAWRAAIRCATEVETPLSPHAIDCRSRAVLFRGQNLFSAVSCSQHLFRDIMKAYSRTHPEGVPFDPSAVEAAGERIKQEAASASASNGKPNMKSGSSSAEAGTIPDIDDPGYHVPKYLSQPLLHAAIGTFGDGLRLSVQSPTGPWSLRFDNRVLNPKIGFIKSGGWRAAVRK